MSSWKVCTVEELVKEGILEKPLDGNHGSIHPKSTDYTDDGIPFIMASDLVSGRVDLESCKFISKDMALSLRKGFAKEGDVLLSHKATIGRTALIQSNKFPFIVLTPQVTYYRVKNNKKLNNVYLKNYFDSYAFQSILNQWAGSGSTRAYIGITDQLKLPIVLPPYQEQEKIADILGSFDDKIQLNTQTNQTLEQIAQAIFKSWFVDFDPVKAKIDALANGGTHADAERAAMQIISGKTNAELTQMQQTNLEAYKTLEKTTALFPSEMVESELGDVPKGWGVTNLGSVSVCFDNQRIPLSKQQREKKKGDIPYYGATSIMDYVDEAIFNGIYLLMGEDGSVIKNDGTPFLQYIWGRSWINNHAHVLQGKGSVSTEHLMLFLSCTNISAYVTGAVQLKLNQKNMNSIPFLLAIDDVNSLFYEKIKFLYEKIRANSEENDFLIKIRDSLLPKLLSGNLG
ncbi:restriction endonuclease subunit S [Pasteurella multocida]|uniref:restriction endonuclease subunit S n=1 Tax=Pasteurella multocida TaxID=747 RepID=UPI00292EC4BB|nr:restriction endonuclease subunit S [Pasteurella multocida]